MDLVSGGCAAAAAELRRGAASPASIASQTTNLETCLKQLSETSATYIQIIFETYAKNRPHAARGERVSAFLAWL